MATFWNFNHVLEYLKEYWSLLKICLLVKQELKRPLFVTMCKNGSKSFYAETILKPHYTITCYLTRFYSAEHKLKLIKMTN